MYSNVSFVMLYWFLHHHHILSDYVDMAAKHLCALGCGRDEVLYHSHHQPGDGKDGKMNVMCIDGTYLQLCNFF